MTRLIGLTGGIAAGKSAVTDMLAELGAEIVDADALAREVSAPGSPGLAEIVARFGAGVRTERGELDRPALAAIVFGDPEARRALEAITHPRIAELSQQRIGDAMAGTAPLVVYAAPLLYENGLEVWLDTVVVVDVDEATQRRRLERRDGSQAMQRVASQLPLAEKRARATHVIDNRGDLASTRAQVEALWKDLVGE